MINKRSLLTWAAFFLVFFFIAQTLQKKPAQKIVNPNAAPIEIIPTETSFVVGEEVIVKVKNNTDASFELPKTCPAPPLTVLAWTGEKFEARTHQASIDCNNAVPLIVPAHGETKVSFSYWNHSIFGTPGRYQVTLALANGSTTGSFTSPEFTIGEAGVLRKTFRTVFYQPLYNVLVLFISIAPMKDLGVAIILLTLLIRLILLVPSQRALISQRRMQELQPKLEHIRKKYAGNQEKIASETMLLWKEHKVNPFGSCLPILIQFPVLIALFYVIQEGLNPDNIYLVYEPFKGIDLNNIHTNFLGVMELTEVNAYVLPVIVGALQFFQFKLSMKKKKPEGQAAPSSEMESANKMMGYILPVMIALFTASTPAGVGLYWGVSTLFAIGQQVVVNKKTAVSNT